MINNICALGGQLARLKLLSKKKYVSKKTLKDIIESMDSVLKDCDKKLRQ
jgi:hypothetical protein